MAIPGTHFQISMSAVRSSCALFLSAGRSMFAFQRRAGLRAVRKEFRKRVRKVKVPFRYVTNYNVTQMEPQTDAKMASADYTHMTLRIRPERIGRVGSIRRLQPPAGKFSTERT